MIDDISILNRLLLKPECRSVGTFYPIEPTDPAKLDIFYPPPFPAVSKQQTFLGVPKNNK